MKYIWFFILNLYVEPLHVFYQLSTRLNNLASTLHLSIVSANNKCHVAMKLHKSYCYETVHSDRMSCCYETLHICCVAMKLNISCHVINICHESHEWILFLIHDVSYNETISGCFFLTDVILYIHFVQHFWPLILFTSLIFSLLIFIFGMTMLYIFVTSWRFQHFS